jgi:hypothetical protein
MNKLKPNSEGKIRMLDLVQKINELVEEFNTLDAEMDAVSRIIYEKIETEDLDS